MLGDWNGNSPNPRFLWSPSLRHNRGSQITTSILTYLARQLINVNSLPFSPAVSSAAHAAGTSFPADRGRRHCKPEEFTFQSQFAHWLSYDFGTPAHSGLSPPFTNPCVHHSQIPEHKMHQGFDWCFVMADLFIVSHTCVDKAVNYFGVNEASLGLICWFCCSALYPKGLRLIFSPGQAEVPSALCWSRALGSAF